MDEDKKPPLEAEDAEMQQSYPSPIVDSTEAQYYHQLASHRDHEPQIDNQPGQPQHHDGLPNLSTHQEQHEDHGLHELQELQEPPTPQQHNSRPSVSVDELQLAAQLTQGLAPMMAAAQMDTTPDQSQERQPQPQQGPVAPPQSEPNLQEQLEASLQNHEREMQSHDHEMQNHNHELQNHELEDVLPHPGQPQQHHYPQNPPGPAHLPPHLSMDHMAANATQYQMPDTTPPRKRSKVSRACDECRRKKIKCDAPSEATEQPCSNCRRSNVQCLFSRVPQKRGPSKGYIKELADRINTIEGKLNTNVEGFDGMARRSSSEAFASPGIGDDSRKRPFSSISGDAFHTPSPSRVTGFTNEHRPLLPLVHSDYRSLQNPPNSHELAPKPAPPPMQFPATASDVGLQSQPEPLMAGLSQNGLPQSSSHPAEQVPEIEDASFDRYLEVIHPTFPVLASTKARVQSLMWQLPSALQSAFYAAFSSMIKPFVPDSNGQLNGDTFTAYCLLRKWETERRSRSPVTDLVHLQALVMIAIAVDCQGIASVKGELAGPAKAEIIGQAVGLGYFMRLHIREVDSDANPELDPNSDDNVALRAWWVLVMLDRWNAIGTATPSLISLDNVVVLPGLKHIVGDVVFALIQISYVLGHITPIAIRPPAEPHPSAAPILGGDSSMVTMSVELLRWAFPTNQSDPVLHLAYWHIRLLSDLLSSPTRPARLPNMLQACRNTVGLLASNPGLLSPLTHHFFVLASLALLELGSVDAKADGVDIRDEAVRLVKLVLEFSVAPSPWNGAVRDKLVAEMNTMMNATTTTRPATSSGSGPSQNLQQLADLATAVETSIAAAEGPSQSEDQGQNQGQGEDGLKEEPPLGSSSAAAVADGSGVNNTKVGGGLDDGAVRHPAVDVRALVRTGYLISCFDEPVKDGLAL